MLKPTSVKNIPHYPVTALLAAVAVVITGLWWAGKGIDAFFMTGRVWEKWELWRGITSIFPHVNIFHLLFNVYWFWVLGTVMERVYGHARFLGIVLLLALGSALAEFSFLEGGVGFSGVGYGLWGMLWVLERRDARFAGTVDDQTSRLFVSWFFICIVLTVTDTMPVANIAHGVGAVMGALLGWAVSSQGKSRALGVGATALLIVLGIGGSTVFWPRVNLSGFAESEIERAGVDALMAQKYSRAIELLETAAQMKGAPARAWFNLGIAYHRIKRYDKAFAAYERAANMPGAEPEMRKAAEQMKEYQAERREELTPRDNPDQRH